MPTKKRIVFAAIAIIISTSVLVPYYLSYLDAKRNVDARYDELTKPLQPYTFQIPMYLRFNGTGPIGMLNESGLAFRLNFTYPNGTLIVNEPVTIDSIAIIDYAYSTLDRVVIFFQNSLAYPLSYEDNGIIPKQGSLGFPNPLRIEDGGSGSVVVRNVSVGSSTQITWPIEGDYIPIIGVFFTDGTNKTYTGSDVVIHVYPKEQLTQLDTERVSLSATQANLRLSEAVFVLGIVGIAALVVQILDHSETDCKYPKNATDNQYRCPYTEQPQTDKPRQIKKKHH